MIRPLVQLDSLILQPLPLPPVRILVNCVPRCCIVIFPLPLSYLNRVYVLKGESVAQHFSGPQS